jgi:hypothetical protein
MDAAAPKQPPTTPHVAPDEAPQPPTIAAAAAEGPAASVGREGWPGARAAAGPHGAGGEDDGLWASLALCAGVAAVVVAVTFGLSRLAPCTRDAGDAGPGQPAAAAPMSLGREPGAAAWPVSYAARSPASAAHFDDWERWMARVGGAW